MTTDADGWIEHDGKGMPVDGGTRVWVRLWKSGTEIGPDQAGEWIWTWIGRPGVGDITHYRIVDEAKTYATEPVMTLRDQFAMAALPSVILVFDTHMADAASRENFATESYRIADAMMTERAK